MPETLNQRRPHPGQYDYLEGFESGVTTYTFSNVPLEDTDGIGSVWLIAHEVVCTPVTP